ncbi:M55 family metallopeptidase [Actinoplanes sp. NPDC051346]|uniref:M55 family metallopeptidase n=1 Tax=Actinoplanes sp. NPDC051346 TaxID=3155048 RepID=UPI00344ACD16
MKVLISADLEGISGIVHAAETNPGGNDYERGRALMTADVNAAVAGVLEAMPRADVLVADAHGSFRNLLPDELDRRARLVRGRPRPLGMLSGLDDTTDALLFVGYHARSGSGPAVLAHTLNDAVLDIRVDGRPMGEIGLNAAMAGHHQAPVVLLTGDDAACAEFLDLVPGATTVAVKHATGQAAATVLHPEQARDQIHRAAAKAIRRTDRVPLLTVPGPVRVDIDLHSPDGLDLATLIPGVTRSPGARTLTFTADDMAQAYGLVQLVAQLTQLKPA